MTDSALIGYIVCPFIALGIYFIVKFLSIFTRR